VKKYDQLQERLTATEAKMTKFASECAMAKHKCEMLETQVHNVSVQLQCECEGKNELRKQIVELETALAEANERIRELEKIIEQKETDNESN
jgi:peptidoglycan hydrolase CwlO-like protein